MDSCFLQNLQLRVELMARGAEMVRFRTVSGQDLLWGGDPQVWPRHAPTLFPVVGRLKQDRLIHQGVAHPMPKHGFARDMDFTLLRLTRETCTFMLRDSEATRASYPFPFELRISYGLDDMSLRIDWELRNPGPEPLPASLGAHPAFRWPLGQASSREGHILRFEAPEEAPLRRLTSDGYLRTGLSDSPVRDGVLLLEDGLFQEDALVFDRLRSRRVRFEGPAVPALDLQWEGFPHLGVWSKPGAEFLCIEPWHGLASPSDFEGEFRSKPGVFLVPPKGERRFSLTVRVDME